MRRILAILVLVLMPLAVRADASDQATMSQNSANSIQPTGSTDGSTQIGSLLQSGGASDSPLQSADAASGGIGLSQTQNLQQSGASDQEKLLIEADGDTPHPLGSSPDLSWLWDVLLVLAATGAGTGAVLLLRRRQPSS